MTVPFSFAFLLCLFNIWKLVTSSEWWALEDARQKVGILVGYTHRWYQNGCMQGTHEHAAEIWRPKEGELAFLARVCRVLADGRGIQPPAPHPLMNALITWSAACIVHQGNRKIDHIYIYINQHIYTCAAVRDIRYPRSCCWQDVARQIITFQPTRNQGEVFGAASSFLTFFFLLLPPPQHFFNFKCEKALYLITF